MRRLFESREKHEGKAKLFNKAVSKTVTKTGGKRYA
jgi:hypothetical protein